MDREEFQAWVESPVTQWVLRATERAAQLQEAAWAQCLWEVKPDTDLVALRNEFRTRADAYRALGQASYEDWCSLLGEEPEEGA